jgi:hypothetical protein
MVSALTACVGYEIPRVGIIYPAGYVAPPSPPPPAYPDNTYPLGLTINATIVYGPQSTTLEQCVAGFRLNFTQAVAAAMSKPPPYHPHGKK